MNSRNKVTCLDEGQQEDEGEGVSSKSVQPQLMTVSNAMQSLDFAALIENKRCTSEATQACHIKNLAAALSYKEDSIVGSQLWMIFSLAVYLMHALKHNDKCHKY